MYLLIDNLDLHSNCNLLAALSSVSPHLDLTSGFGLGSAIGGKMLSFPSWQIVFAPIRSCLNNLILEKGGKSGKGRFGLE